MSAFHADDAVASLLICAARIEQGPVELLCGMHPQPEIGAPEGQGIRVHGCLAGLGAGALLMLASLGIEKIIVRTDACKVCTWASLQEQIEKQVSQARLFLAIWGRADTIVCQSNAEKMVQRPVWDSKNPPLSRRDLFRMLAQQGKVAMARAMENGHTPHGRRSPGRDRLRLLTALKHLPVSESNTKISLGSLGFANITISEACTACSVCGRACPTDALQFEKNENGTAYALKFNPQNCIGCDVCVHVCASSAVSVDHDPQYSQVFGKSAIILQEGELVKCQNCGALMAKHKNGMLCSLCQYRSEHPFGSMLQPGVRPLTQKRGRHGNA